MTRIEKSQIIDIVKRALSEADTEGVVRQMIYVFPPPARVFLVGGFIRDAVLRSYYDIDTSPRDLDFVVFGVPSTRLDEHLMGLGKPSRTTLGGAKVRVGQWSIDVWTPYQQIEVAGGKPYSCTPEVLPNYSTLTIDAVIFDCVRAELYECNFLRAISSKTIDVGPASKWTAKWAPYHLAHLASVWASTRFNLSSNVLRRIVENDSPVIRGRAVSYLKEHKKTENAAVLVENLICKAQAIVAEPAIP